MKDPTNEIINALHDAISGNVTYNSKNIPVYTRVIEWGDRTVDQFIQIAEASLIEDGPKDAYLSRGTVSIYVDTFFEGKNAGSWLPANSISTAITQLIDTIFSLSGFIQILGEVAAIESFDYDLDDGGAVFRKLITYGFIIEELIGD